MSSRRRGDKQVYARVEEVEGAASMIGGVHTMRSTEIARLILFMTVVKVNNFDAETSLLIFT